MRAFIKRIIPADGFIFRLCKTIYHLLRRDPYYWQIDLLEAYANYKKNIKFIQIGSNNGVNGDPIFDYVTNNGWQGILVEPVPYLFEELKNTYKDYHDKLFFENSAISNKSGKLKFYRLEKSDFAELPIWYDQIGSFKKEVVLKHRDSIPLFDDLFIEDAVYAITFKELLTKYAVNNLDLLHIDTEGYDFEIIQLVPFSDLNIDLIMFEHRHLSKSDLRKAIKLLSINGYKAGIQNDADVIAIKRQVLKPLKRVSA